jgi:dGTPase
VTARGYDSHATARRAAEPRKQAQGQESARGDFVRDRARVLHSAALRRLAAKTQVVEVGAGDFPRTRLTHSLECAQIGRELGAALGCDPDLVDAACLAHDLGHPPFGHNGELALAGQAAGFGGFEGNAQSLRLLTRLEAKVPGAGLNLTRATLDATIKYPWAASRGPAGEAGGVGSGAVALGAGPGSGAGPAQGSDPAPAPGQATGKFGYYADDAEVFAWIREEAPDGRTCLESQVMDWADDVAYSVHDLEDGLHAGHITLAALRDPAERQVLAELTAEQYCPLEPVSVAELAEVFSALLDLPFWPGSFDGGPRALAALKHLTSELIGRFCRTVEQATLAAARRAVPALAGADGGGGGTPGLTRYAASLLVPRQQRLECALLKGVTAHYVMSREGAAAVQARQRELIAELTVAVAEGAPGTLDRSLRPAHESAACDAERARVVIDQIASLTDTSAMAWHTRLCRPQSRAAAVPGPG